MIVTPYVGVWIEIFNDVTNSLIAATSLPTWECGLKFRLPSYNKFLTMSLPTWECGLKSATVTFAWFVSRSLPTWECGLKSVVVGSEYNKGTSLPTWECGLKFGSGIRRSVWIRHSLRGSVDWNLFVCFISEAISTSLPTWECGLKSLILRTVCVSDTVTPYVGVWIEIFLPSP